MGKRLNAAFVTALLLASIAVISPFSATANVAADMSIREGDAPKLSSAEFENQVLAAHNFERSRFGSPKLVWDKGLAKDAAGWARHLAQTNSFEHADGISQGENLWMGDSAAYRPEEMVGLWVSEKKLFKPGVFPAVSRSSDWTDVGHYTQLVWPKTRKIGCALAQGHGNDYLVCRYDPAGNVIGTKLSHVR